MSGKKIEFTRKPLPKNAENFIDNWVSGEKNVSQVVSKLKRTTIYLPEEIRHEIKLIALKQDTTMTDIIIEAINKHLKQ